MTEEPAPPAGPAAGLTRLRVGGADVIRAGDELDVYFLPALRQAAADAALVARGRLVIDLTGTQFLDRFCLGELHDTLKRIRAAGGLMSIACDGRNVRQAIKDVGLSRMLPVCDSLDAAVSAVTSDSRELA
jgi:anti-sigma B factor antagonist